MLTLWLGGTDLLVTKQNFLLELTSTAKRSLTLLKRMAFHHRPGPTPRRHDSAKPGTHSRSVTTTSFAPLNHDTTRACRSFLPRSTTMALFIKTLTRASTALAARTTSPMKQAITGSVRFTQNLLRRWKKKTGSSNSVPSKTSSLSTTRRTQSS